MVSRQNRGEAMATESARGPGLFEVAILRLICRLRYEQILERQRSGLSHILKSGFAARDLTDGTPAITGGVVAGAVGE